ncbi:MAG: PAS domain S-box protein [Anaerolineae bacterium]|nr:PAS domain S-box protein [Anaerolineae bacterium]MCB9102899.1 PAS domain S-box protein [Anaerolineales bacterium]
MNDTNKTRNQLLIELNLLRQRVAELEYQNSIWQQAEAERQWLQKVDHLKQDTSAALHWAGTTLSSILSYEKVLDEILEQVRRLVPCTAACMLILGGKTTRMFRSHGYQDSDTFTSFKSTPLNFSQIPILDKVRNTGWPLASPNVDEDDVWVMMADQSWIRSSICLPIRTTSRMLGFLRLDSSIPGFYTQMEAERLFAFANQAAIAMKNAQLHERSRKEIVNRVKELKKERNFIATVLDTTDALVVVTDAEGKIVQFNRACEAATGYTLAEVKDTILADVLLVPRECQTVKTALEALNSGQPPVIYENQWQTKAGDRRLIAWSSTGLFDKNGNIDHIVSTGTDITEQKQTQEEREKLIDELEAFAHTVAHDLQEPLAPIIGFADATSHYYGTLSEVEIKQNLEAIVKNGQKMSTIINELLLLAGVRQRQVELTPLDMDKIVAEVKQRLSYMLEQQQGQIKLPDNWETALGYAPWVEEVWVNYLSNALKYGGEPPRLELGSTRLADGMVKFWVRDNGPGLPPGDWADLFTPFTRLDHSLSKGHGLGLSIVRRIIERLGGQVGIESLSPGQGSIFSFTLPAGEQSMPKAA